MRPRLPLFLGIAALAASAAFAAEAKAAARAPQDTPAARLSAAQIAERNVKARGGLARWRAVTALRISGEMDAGGKSDAKLPFVLALKRPHKSRLEISFAGKNAVQTWDGAQGWKLRPFLDRDDVEPLTPAEAKSEASSVELDGPLVDYSSKGTKLELTGTERVEGRQTYKLKLTLKSGEQRSLWVDASTFLETKISGEPRKLDGRPHNVEIYYRDYRSVDGLKVPYRLETAVEGVKQRHAITLRTVTVNPALGDALFAKPTVAMARPAGGRVAP